MHEASYQARGVCRNANSLTPLKFRRKECTHKLKNSERLKIKGELNANIVNPIKFIGYKLNMAGYYLIKNLENDITVRRR
tara:strand:- start:346 stop:585 length:240 start_codon:yes stop_codon:yes gene_type:complete